MPQDPTTDRWEASRTRFVIVAALGLSGVLNIAAVVWAVSDHPSLNSDFMAFWSFPRFAAGHPIAEIYHAVPLERFQQALYPGFGSFYPYLYPPTLLLPIWWLRFCGFGAAETIWTIAGIAALAAAARWFFPPGRRYLAIFVLLASPAALLNGATGETAFFTTALLLAGFAALPARPVLAGICFGLLTLKPQLGVLIPFALLARQAWRAIAVAGIVALILVGLSCIAFPAALWGDWARTLPAYQASYFAAAKALNLHIIVTVAANLVTLGVPAGIAWLAQCIVTTAVIAAVFLAFRFAPHNLAVALLFTGGFLAVPHAYAYDTVPLGAALILLAGATGLTLPFTALAVMVYLGPLMLLSPASSCFLYAIPEIALFLLILRHAFTKPEREITW